MEWFLGLAVGLSVSFPFFLFQWIIVWHRQLLRMEAKTQAIRERKIVVWVMMVHALKLFVMLAVLLALSRTDARLVMGAGIGFFLGILANGVLSYVKGADHGSEN